MNFAILTESKYFETTYMNVQQIKRYHPESIIYIGDLGLTDDQKKDLNCEIVDLSYISENTDHFKMFMKPLFLMNLPLAICYMDADVVLMKPLDLQPEKDITVTVRDSRYGRINSGVFILSDRKLLSDWIQKTVHNLLTTYDRLSEQNALNDIAYNYNMKEVPCDIYNYPKVEKGIPDDVVVVHLKSGRFEDPKMVDIVREKINNE